MLKHALICTVLFALASEAADRPQVRRIAEFETGPDPEMISSVVPTPDGGALLAGFTSSNTAGQMDAFAGKLDSDGEVEWEHTYGDTLCEEFYTAIPTGDGGYIAAGTSNSYGDLAFDFYVVRLDGQGNVLSSNTYGALRFDVATSLVPDGEGGWYVGGFSAREDVNKADFRLTRIDSNGALLWSQTYGEEEHDFLLAMVRANDGGLVLAGSTHSFDAENRDVLVIKVDAEGAQQWQQVIGGPYPDYVNDMIVTQEGDFVLAGVTHQYDLREESDLYLLRLSADGWIVWETTVGGDSWDEGWGVVQSADGGFFAAGNSFSAVDGVMNAYGVRFDAAGNVLWTQSYGDVGGYQEFRTVGPWDSEIVLAAGYTSSTENNDADFLVMEVDASSEPVAPSEWTVTPEFTLSAPYPNPFNASLAFHVTLPRRGDLEVRVFNLLGREVRLLTKAPWAAGRHRFHWRPLPGTASGTYIIEARTEDHAQRERVLFVK
ncbi:MAG: hypothetical protein MAG453_01036 [Calditrichaeota bacterium]|nr:hypothetical protein [Calditrichota bacterium]